MACRCDLIRKIRDSRPPSSGGFSKSQFEAADILVIVGGRFRIRVAGDNTVVCCKILLIRDVVVESSGLNQEILKYEIVESQFVGYGFGKNEIRIAEACHLAGIVSLNAKQAFILRHLLEMAVIEEELRIFRDRMSNADSRAQLPLGRGFCFWSRCVVGGKRKK